MALYTMVCRSCEYSYQINIPVKDFDTLMPLERGKKCSMCGGTDSLYNYIGAPRVIFKGAGWTKRVFGNNVDARIEAEEREHDQLNEAKRYTGAFRKKDEEFRRYEEKAKEQAYKTNGVAID